MDIKVGSVGYPVLLFLFFGFFHSPHYQMTAELKEISALGQRAKAAEI